MSTKDPVKNQLMNRRQALRLLGGVVGGAALASTAGWWAHQQFGKKGFSEISGAIVGANSKVGHLLREGVHIEPAQTLKIDTLIVGGGIAGLSAAWWLQKQNHQDFLVFEMDDETGGNSRGGENPISKYPWAAHYVPLPSVDAKYVRELFADLGIITGYDRDLPVYNEYFLCADPHERLFYQGQWSDSMVPQIGLSAVDKADYKSFFALIEELKHRRGRDQKAAFCIPLEDSSQDPELLALDRLSMSTFMDSKGWHSKVLRWYVDYCCRDDYGAPASRVSAWAGLHYFASRAGVGANADSQTVLTWPEGNAWIARRLHELAQTKIRTHSLVYRITNQKDHCQVDVLNTQDMTAVRYQARQVIYAGPRFTAKRVIAQLPDFFSPEFAPWAVANISLRAKPTGQGAPLSWDNVSYYSPSLGYIVANHQDLRQKRQPAVITYYLPLDSQLPKEARLQAYRQDFAHWRDRIVQDLENMHPGIHKDILHLDVWIWGHGMPNPGIDYLWSQKRQDLLKSHGRIHFAHSDMSGISIFEEAQYRGVEAARKVLESDPLRRRG